MNNPVIIANKSKSPNYYMLPVLLGAAFALILISVFLFSDPTPDPAWGKYYMIRPLVVVTFAGACGGAFYAFMSTIEKRGFWQKLVAAIICIIVYVVGIWFGSVLGLNGTYWN